jgi:asparagine synthase (glutamine-hydrolysing)
VSGFCALVRRDGAPVDVELLEELTTALSARGPDARGTWIGGPAGLGHTLLTTTDEAKPGRQPISLDGTVWIAADARIDGRLELTRALKARGRQLDEPLLDAELILHAYHAWGDDCVAHLIGDFAFVVWDARAQRLFGARDHFGVKPFFYASLGQQFVCSNTLACIRRHPAVTDRLNKEAIADFLLLDHNHDAATTAFADIRRLAPGTRMAWANGSLRQECYWSIPAELPLLRYRDDRDYVAHFSFLLRQAVADRLRTGRVAVAMSGGLDSPAIAALARSELRDPCAVRAQTVVYDQLIPDSERHFAAAAARHIGIEVDYIVGDGYAPYDAQRRGLATLPDPLHNPGVATYMDATSLSANHGRVALTGWDGDALLNESPKPYLRSLVAQRRYFAAAVGAARYAASERRVLPRGFWHTLAAGRQRPEAPPVVPSWIARDFAGRHDLRARLLGHSVPLRAPHPARPYAYRTLHSVADDPTFFDGFDPAFTRSRLEYRHPLLDLRLLEFALSLPVFPWCVRKEILRRSSAGLLPENVRRRPKTTLAASPMERQLRRPEFRWVNHFQPNSRLGAFVDTAMISRMRVAQESSWERWVNLRPLSLNFWLDSL